MVWDWIDTVKRARSGFLARDRPGAAALLYCEGIVRMPITGKKQQAQASTEYEVATRVTLASGARVVVKMTAEAIERRGRAACIAMAAAKIRAVVGAPPEEIIVSTSDFR